MPHELTFRPPGVELRDVLIGAGYNLARVKELIDDAWLEARQFTWDDVTREIARRRERLRLLRREQRVLRVRDATGTQHVFRLDGETFVRQLRGAGCVPRRTSVRTPRPAARPRSASRSRDGPLPPADDDPDPEPERVAVPEARP